ncbi:MAG: Rpn family recombination-promoting nuclease/putative transposase [Treponema sp.]|nr:Rpn family recombination-promoting nuclease/putative transposase [Treponema sp.]
MDSNVNRKLKNKSHLRDVMFPADADILPPSDDRIFKTLLIHPDARQVLIDVVSTVIERKVVDVQIRNNEVSITDVNEKAERFDVNCTVENGDQVDVEMHCSKREETGEKRTNFINKCTYYLADLHSSQKSRGVMYKDMVRTFQVTFSTHTVFPARSDFVSKFSLRTADGEQFGNQLNIVIIELDKLKNLLGKPVENLTSFEKWSLFLKYAADPVHRDLINDIIKEKEEIGMAATILREISKDERERAIFRSRQMAETDRISDLLTAEERGMIRGREEGREEERLVIARNFVNYNLL